jgi:DNA-binding PadR family transcriptional regulator
MLTNCYVKSWILLQFAFGHLALAAIERLGDNHASVADIGRQYRRPSFRFRAPMLSEDLLHHFFGGFVRLHILYHADKEPICGVELIEELGRHGYRLSPGTLYPILHELEAGRYLKCDHVVVAGRRRKNYRITARGRRLLAQAREKLRELFSEVVEDRSRRAADRTPAHHD